MKSPLTSSLIARVLLAVFALLTAYPSLAEGDLKRGQQLANMCIGCHNIDNYSIAFPVVYKIPRIRGQKAEYIKYALQEYASGNRYTKELNRLASMPAIASSLTEQDIEDLAAYYSSL